MNDVLAGYATFVGIVRLVLFWLAVVATVVALVDWLVRTRRLNPFGPIARFFRMVVDPVMVPVDRRILRMGRVPTEAPWWTLGVIVVGGILLIALLNVLAGFVASIIMGLSSPASFGLLLLSWAFGFLRIALIVRVIS